MTEILKPCPFCGNEHLELQDNTAVIYGFNGYRINCKQCGTTMKSSPVNNCFYENGKLHTPMKNETELATVKKALIDKWNGRAVPVYSDKKNENTCVCCGASIPEGKHVCRKCEIEHDSISELLGTIKMIGEFLNDIT